MGMNGPPKLDWMRALGPGLLFAAAAVGVSHLVQSTRAGASYGLAMLVPILLANAIKYPAFRFGPQYAAATGTSLLEGYRRQGRWALVLYALLTVGTMFAIQAAVTVVTAALAMATLGLKASPVIVSVVILAICGALLGLGRYHWLERITRVLVAVLTISTVIAAVAALPLIDWSGPVFPSLNSLDVPTVFFIVALVGWMPSAIDVSVWQSLWILARREDTKHTPTVREAVVDFHVGYIGTALLAVCFLVMGAGVMHNRGVVLVDSAGGFAGQVIQLYTTTLGAWSAPIIGVSAFFVMFSTTLTVLDGFPRAIAVLLARFHAPEENSKFEMNEFAQRRAYLAAMALLASGAVVVLWLVMTSLKAMVDIATTLSFLTAPLLALLNHRAVLGSDVAPEHRPRPWLRIASWLGILSQTSFALYYAWLRYH